MTFQFMRSVPRTRVQFERNINILIEAVRRGKVVFPLGMSTESFERVRRLPNGRVDLTSIDERVRLHANTIANFDIEGNFQSDDDE